MSLDPLLRAPAAVQFHVAIVLPMVLIGAWLVVFSRKGERPHRALGYIYVTLIVITAIDSLFVHAIAPHNFLGLSPIHLAVPLDLAAIAIALGAAWKHNIALHRGAMIALYIGVLITGALTVLPGRVLYAVVFGG